MKIAINTRFLLKNKIEGIGMFTQEIFKRVVQLMPEHEFYFLFDRAYDESFVFAKNVIPITISPPARHPVLWYIWFEHAIPKVLKKHHIDLFISPDGFGSLSTIVPQIVTIHDLGFEHYPEHTPFLVRHFYQYFTPKYCQKASKLIAVSNATKQDIISKYGVDENKISIVFNGFEDCRYIINNEQAQSLSIIDKRISDKTPYFIFIGAVHPRKNVLNLLKAFELFKQTFTLNYQLLIVGRNAWMNAELETYYQQMKYKNDVIWIENIERVDLLQLLQNAFALCYPSWFEGFGIPIIEAMSLGVPVITSNTSSMAEIAANAGIMVAPDNIQEIATAMHLLTSDNALRQDLIDKGKIRAKEFDWNKSALQVVQLIKTYE